MKLIMTVYSCICIIIGLCRRDDLEAIFYTLVALMNTKLSKLSNYKRKPRSDKDLQTVMSPKPKETAAEKG
jgi:hypothetical protein